MKSSKSKAAQAVIVCVMALSLSVNLYAGAPNSKELGAAVSSGDFTEYIKSISAWLIEKTPADPSKISDATMRQLLKDPVFALVLDQRRFLTKAGVAEIGAFSKSSEANRKFLADFLGRADLMDLYLEGGAPLGNDYVGSLGVLRTILEADSDARKGMHLKLAIATSLAHAKIRNCWGYSEPIDPLKRYQHFKAAQKNNELVPMFDDLSVWEYAKVVDTAASDKDLTWARELVRTMRPEVLREARFIDMAREVQYGKANWGPPPHNFATIINGGGACGPRAWFGRMINQAFGVPVWGVKQPGHAAVGFLGNTGWKVVLGAGWDKSTWDKMRGPQFLEIVHAREYAVDFSQAEHLRWLAETLTSKAQADAVKSAAGLIQKNPKGPKTEHRLTPRKYPAPQKERPYTPVAGVQHLAAVEWANAQNAFRGPSFDVGQQVYFQKNKDAWVEYKVNVPKAETYGITIGHATANGTCRVRVYVGDTRIGWMSLNNTTGLWGKTKECDFRLPKTDILRFVFPSQRGVAVKWFELKAKSDAPASSAESEPESGVQKEAVDPRNPEPAE